MLEAGLIISRFLHFAAATALFGVSLYPFYTYHVRVHVTAGAKVVQMSGGVVLRRGGVKPGHWLG